MRVLWRPRVFLIQCAQKRRALGRFSFLELSLAKNMNNWFTVFAALISLQLFACTSGDGDDTTTPAITKPGTVNSAPKTPTSEGSPKAVDAARAVPAVVSSEAKEGAVGVSDGSELARLRAKIEKLTKDNAELKSQYEECNKLITESKEFGDYLTRLYFDEKKHLFDGPKATTRLIRDDDPIIHESPGARMTLLYFTDMTCSNCESFERYLSKTLKPLYKGHLRIVYKHFPRHNQAQSEPLHKALEAARIQGQFWEMKEVLMDRPMNEASREELLGYAEDVGLDVVAFAEDMDSPQTKARIEQDVRWGRQIGVSSTPTVYLNGRRVDKKMRTSLLFWNSRAEALKDSREARNQDW